MTMELFYWALTLRGRRSENEDAVQVTGREPLADEQIEEGRVPLDTDGVIAAIADGVGGGPDGRLAARTGLATLCERRIDGNEPQALEEALQRANTAVMSLAGPRGNPASTVGGLSFSSNRILAFNLGDTRVYALNDGKPSVLSVDHRSTFDRRSITRFWGGQLAQSTPHIREVPFDVGDFLVCSDGLYAFLRTEDLSMPQRPAPATGLRAIVELAIAQGSTDNVSLAYCSIRRAAVASAT